MKYPFPPGICSIILTLSKHYQFHKVLDVLFGKQQQSGITLKGLSSVSLAESMGWKACGQLNSTRAGTQRLHSTRQDQSFSSRNHRAECRRCSLHLLCYQGLTYTAGPFPFHPSRQWPVCNRNNIPRTKWHCQLQKKWDRHLWSHPQASPINSLSGETECCHLVYFPPLRELCVTTSAVRLSHSEGS